MRNDKEMARKGNWFSSVKKALSPESKEKTDQVWRNSLYLLSTWVFSMIEWVSDSFSDCFPEI